LFLDEIGELPLDLQPRLLRALDNRSVRRVGGGRDRQVDVRIVAATNRDLASLVEAKQFRQDLYFRLAAAVVPLPPLRDRLEDLPILVPQLLADLGRGFVHVPEATYEALRAHAWPGNVRELKNVLSYALAFVDAGVLEPGQLRFAPAASEASPLERLPLGGQSLLTLEQIAIRQTLALTRGNKVQAARMLGIASSTLYEKLKRHGL
jgi:transcriptional regulator with PAS, ATPase and Fis domain